MGIGQADQDYHGEKEQEVDVTDQTEIKLDHSACSLIFNLRTEAENISRIDLVPMQVRHRVPIEEIEVFYKAKRDGSLLYPTGSQRMVSSAVVKYP